VREVLDGIFYGLSYWMPMAGVAERPAAEDAVHHYFVLWNWDGALQRIPALSMGQAANRKGAKATRASRLLTARAPRALKRRAQLVALAVSVSTRSPCAISWPAPLHESNSEPVSYQSSSNESGAHEARRITSSSHVVAHSFQLLDQVR
jgi:hypothetical protein